MTSREIKDILREWITDTEKAGVTHLDEADITSCKCLIILFSEIEDLKARISELEGPEKHRKQQFC